jgi:hypothetical protein
LIGANIMNDERITTADIAAGEKLLGIEYTPAEREFMVENLDGPITAAKAQREVIFPKSLPPATTFAPRLPGTMTPMEQKPSWVPRLMAISGLTVPPGIFGIRTKVQAARVPGISQRCHGLVLAP